MDLSLFLTTDEDGNEVELSRPETKSWSDVDQCIEHNNGANCCVVANFIRLALLGDQWNWYADYKEWLTQCEKVDAYNDARVADEETGELPEEMPTPEIPPRPEANLDRIKALYLEQINRSVDKKLSSILAPYPQAEVVTWDIQMLEAENKLDDKAMIESLAANRGVPLTEVEQRVITKEQNWKAYAGQVIGQKQKLSDRLEQASTVDEVLSLEWG